VNKLKPNGMEISKEKLIEALRKSTQKSFVVYGSEAKSVLVKIPI